jgi:hypothetical protein
VPWSTLTADDDTLRQLSDRIQARAVRRMGELLKQFDARGAHMKNDGAVNSHPSQREVAERAGVSERQRATAIRVANVPEEKFEAAIEAPKPATVTRLAEMGKQVRSVPQEGFKRAEAKCGIHSSRASGTTLMKLTHRFQEVAAEKRKNGQFVYLRDLKPRPLKARPLAANVDPLGLGGLWKVLLHVGTFKDEPTDGHT